MREKMLQKLAHWHAYHPWRMLQVVLLLTIIFGFFAGQLKLTMRWSDLLPSGDKRTIQFNKIIDEFTAATSLVVVVQGEESRIKKFAEDLAPRILTAIDTSKNASLQKEIDKINKKINQLKTKENDDSKIVKLQSEIITLQARMDKKLFKRVDYKTEIDFLRNHGLILFLDGIQNLVLKLQKAARGEELPDEEAQQAVDKLLFGEPYFLSYDKEALILNAIPDFSMMDADLLVTGADAAQAIVDDLLKDYPDVKAGLTGMIAIGRDEMVYSAQSLGYTTVIAMIAILLLLMISFRMWVAPIFAIANLLVGLVWAVGTVAIVVGQLNMMTQMMAVILLGLGIDFSIHIISGFTERRAAGDSIAEAMEKTFLKSGKGILTGALTTACAFLTLVISHSRGMKEMGLATGTGEKERHKTNRSA
jgi:predicted RND superfamily exporter protein